MSKEKLHDKFLFNRLINLMLPKKKIDSKKRKTVRSSNFHRNSNIILWHPSTPKA